MNSEILFSMRKIIANAFLGNQDVDYDADLQVVSKKAISIIDEQMRKLGFSIELNNIKSALYEIKEIRNIYAHAAGPLSTEDELLHHLRLKSILNNARKWRQFSDVHAEMKDLSGSISMEIDSIILDGFSKGETVVGRDSSGDNSVDVDEKENISISREKADLLACSMDLLERYEYFAGIISEGANNDAVFFNLAEPDWDRNGKEVWLDFIINEKDTEYLGVSNSWAEGKLEQIEKTIHLLNLKFYELYQLSRSSALQSIGRNKRKEIQDMQEKQRKYPEFQALKNELYQIGFDIWSDTGIPIGNSIVREDYINKIIEYRICDIESFMTYFSGEIDEYSMRVQSPYIDKIFNTAKRYFTREVSEDHSNEE